MYDRLMVGLSIQFRCMIKVFYDEGHSACNISCTCTVSETCTSKNPLFPTPNPRRCENDQRNVEGVARRKILGCSEFSGLILVAHD